MHQNTPHICHDDSPHYGLPPRPFSEEPVGVCSFDGPTVEVRALVCTPDGAVTLLNVTGADVSVSATLMKLLRGATRDDPGTIAFTPAPELPWAGPTLLKRESGTYTLIPAALKGLREKNHAIVSSSALLGAGLRRPPTLPAAEHDPTPAARPSTPASDPPPRIVFGAAGQDGPNPGAFIGHLIGMRVVLLPQWEPLLWEHGRRAGLITPLPTLGIAAWQLAPTLRQWNALVQHGRVHGRLPIPVEYTRTTSA